MSVMVMESQQVMRKKARNLHIFNILAQEFYF